ncbi:MAG TPA: tetratricopeptide repeat-containing protein kinase family protein, partial [Gemmataceae bacterium]|nr:tetratricopeptide repeat-containing protein kinase family protein [Gemmataceae bacterium]
PAGEADGQTVAGLVLGTPAYMPPEQAEGRHDLHDRRSDVYALGAILYEILTGVIPFDAANTEALLEKIRREPPPLPRSHKHNVPRPLEAVCLKALAKRREDRYPSAMALADDVQHWLADEQVSCYGEPLSVRAGRWARKHKPFVATAAAVLLTATVGLAVGLYFVNAEKNRAELARRGEEQQRIAVEAKEAETRAVLDFVQKHVFAAARPEGKKGGLGINVSLRQALKAALAAIDKSFPNQPLVEARVRRTLGDTFLLLGEPETAAGQLQRALAIHTEQLGADDAETLRTANNLAMSYRDLGNLPEAQSLLEQTLTARTTKLGPGHVDTIQSMQNLATVYAEGGRYRDGLQLREQVLAIRKVQLGPDDPETLNAMTNLANSYSENGDAKKTLQIDEQVFALLKAKFGADHIETFRCRNNLALDYAAVHRYQEALALQQESLALHEAKYGKDHLLTLTAANNVAKALADLERYEEAITVLEETLRMLKAKYSADHPLTAHTIYSLGNHHGKLKHWAEALKFHQEALELRRKKLGPNHRDTLFSMWGVASNLIELNRGAEAVPIIDECLRRAAGVAFDPCFYELADQRLRLFEKAVNAPGCRATAELWEKTNFKDAESHFHAARYRAVTAAVLAASKSPDAARQSAVEADRSIAWLKKAIAAGYKDAEGMNAEKDLLILRDRPDFRKLIAEVEAKHR